MKFISILVFIVFLITGVVIKSKACTNFVIGHNGKMLYYLRNYDRDMRNSLIVVNKRGVYKRAQVSLNKHSWISKYGSITNNQYGRDFPVGGMNEKGLVIEVMVLDETKSYEGKCNLPAVNPSQWVQYQLDVSQSVEEVIENAKKVRVVDLWVPLHYLVCDATGCAVIEYLGDSVRITTGEELGVKVGENFIPVRASANSVYSESIHALKGYEGFGGNLPAPVIPLYKDFDVLNSEDSHVVETSYSITRFIRAASTILKVEEKIENGEPFTADSAYKAMDIIVQKKDWSKFQLVYDIQNKGVSWRSIIYADTINEIEASSTHPMIFLKDFDFDNDKPVLISNMQDPDEAVYQRSKEKPIDDLVYGGFTNYSEYYNKKIVELADQHEIKLASKAKGFLGGIVSQEVYENETDKWWAEEFMRPLWYKYPEKYTSTKAYVSDTMLLNFYLSLLLDPLSKTMSNMIYDKVDLSVLNKKITGHIQVNPYLRENYKTKLKLFPPIKLNELQLINGWDYYVVKIPTFEFESTKSYVYFSAGFTGDLKAGIYFWPTVWIPGHYELISPLETKWVNGKWEKAGSTFQAEIKYKGVSFQGYGPFKAQEEEHNSCVSWAKLFIAPDYDDLQLDFFGASYSEAKSLDKTVKHIYHEVFSSTLMSVITPIINAVLLFQTPMCINGSESPECDEE